MMNAPKSLFSSIPLFCLALALGPLAAIGCDVGKTSAHASGAGGAGGSEASAGGGSPVSSGSGVVSSGSGTTSGGGGSSNGGYYVKGNTIYDANGKPHLFHGLARPSL